MLSKFFQNKYAIQAVRLLPFSVSRYVIHKMGAWYYYNNTVEKRAIVNELHRVFDVCHNKREMKHIVKEVFRGIFDHYHEKLYQAYCSYRRVSNFLLKNGVLKSEITLEKAVKKNRGVIFVTGHFGAVEFLPGFLALNGYDTSIVCRFQNRRLRNMFLAKAKESGLEVIDADKGNVLIRILAALKRGRIVITEVDEFDSWKNKGGAPVDFLGKSFPADNSIDILQKRSGACVVQGFMTREIDGRYVLHVRSIPRLGNFNQDALEDLEAAIWVWPGQWYQWTKFSQQRGL